MYLRMTRSRDLTLLPMIISILLYYIIFLHCTVRYRYNIIKHARPVSYKSAENIFATALYIPLSCTPTPVMGPDALSVNFFGLQIVINDYITGEL